MLAVEGARLAIFFFGRGYLTDTGFGATDFLTEVFFAFFLLAFTASFFSVSALIVLLNFFVTDFTDCFMAFFVLGIALLSYLARTLLIAAPRSFSSF